MSKHRLHPAIPEMQEKLREGRITRREFLRFATLLGASTATANLLAACAPEPTAPTVTQQAQATAVPATAVAASAIKRGGTMRVAGRVPRVDHPARYAWMEGYNITRHVCEHLAVTMADGITVPWLLERWEANDDVDEWTLYLRQGSKFNDGSDFTVDDVIFNFQQWLDPDIGSAMLGLMSYLTPDNIERVDDYTLKLYLNSPNIGVPEHLYDKAATIVPRTFEGDILAQPVGTGPFLIEEYIEGERAVLKARTDYWKMGEDGQPLPYLDEVIWFDLGEDQTAWLSALQSGQVDKIFNPLPEQLPALREMEDVVVYSGTTGATYVYRMRVDMEPWNDNRVRQALKLCLKRNELLELAHYGEGVLAADAHVSPAHPEYCEKPIPEYDTERAKELLTEAGYPDGVQVTITAMTNTPEGILATALKEMAAPAGFDITVDLVPASQYWEMWTDVPFGVTVWGHRPLGTMVLAIAYVGDDEGNPVDWNETRWVDEEFSELLREAERTLDVEARREIMCKLEDIQIERGSVAIPFWRNSWHAVSKKFKNYRFDPNPIDDFTEVWYDPEA